MEILVFFKKPNYLVRILKDYLKDRYKTYDTKNRPTRKAIIAGVAQVSTLDTEL